MYPGPPAYALGGQLPPNIQMQMLAAGAAAAHFAGGPGGGGFGAPDGLLPHAAYAPRPGAGPGAGAGAGAGGLLMQMQMGAGAAAAGADKMGAALLAARQQHMLGGGEFLLPR